MKKKSLLFLLLFALMAPWAANAQSTYSWGGPSDYGAYGYNANPFGRHYGFEYRVYLYPPNTMDFSGNITQIEFLPYNTMNSNGGDFTVWMKETSISSLNDATTFSEYRSGATEVYHTSSSPAYTAGTYVGITLDTPFPHSQENYLMILVRSVANSTNGDGGTAFYSKNPDNSPALTWYGKKDGSDGDPDHLTNWGTYGVNSASLPVIRWTYTNGSGSPCPAPTLGEAQYVDEDGASFQWTENGSSQDWVLQYSTNSDFTNATSVDRHGIPALAISGLNSGTTYYVRVRSVCNPSQIIWSNVVSFTTTAVAENVGEFWYDNFEGNSCRWNLINGTQTNKWTWGTADSGSHALYISNDGGTTNAYTISSTSVVYATKLLHFTEGRFEFFYEWKAQGESNYDYLRAWLAPASATFTAGQLPNGTTNFNGYTNTTPEGWIALGGKQNQATTWQTEIVATEINAGDYYLVFMWGNDYSDGYQPPAVIDNVRITHLTCPYDVENLTVNDITSTTVSLSWTAGEATQWQIFVNEGNGLWLGYGENFTTNTPTLTDLTPDTYHEVIVRSVCSDGDLGTFSLISFTTLETCPPPTNLTITEVMPNGCRASFTPGSSEPTTWCYSITTTPDAQPGWFVPIYGLTDNSFELQNGNYYMDFEPETTYYLWVGMNCEDEWHTAGPAEFTTLEACPIPANVEVSDITYNSATVTWNGYNDFYHVQWGWPSQTSLNATFTDDIPTDWNNSSDYPWTIVDGHMQSSNGGHDNSSSIISVTKTLYDAGTIEFDAECKGEGTGSYLYDKCIFSIDGEEQFVYGNQGSGWNHYSFNVTAGEHTFTWSYTKDNTVDPQGDYFAVDNVLLISNEIYWLEDEDITVNDGHSANLTGLNPNMLYCVKVQGVCNDDDFDLLKDGGGNWSGDELGTHTDWTDPVFFTTLKLPTLTQTITLTAGTNWFSTYLNISLENLQDALVDALPGVTSMTIKSKNSTSRWNGSQWRNANGFVWDVAKMYMIEVPEDCELVLNATLINPAAHTITIEAGTPTWIGFPFSESKTFSEAIPAGFAVNGDQIKYQNATARFNGTNWRGSAGFTGLEPGKGYMYVPASNVTTDRILDYSTNAK